MVLGNFRSFHVLVLTLRVLGLPYSFNPVITVPLSSLRLVSSSSSVWRFLLLVSQMLRPSKVILYVAVRTLGPLLITVYQVTSYR